MSKMGVFAVLVVVATASSSARAEVTSLVGADYASLCQSRGIPLPPRWGENDPARPRWTFNGTISGTDVFIVQGMNALAYYYASSQGVCMALPRYNPGATTTGLLGVICESNAGKVCFWDAKNVLVNPLQPISIASTNAQDLIGSPWIGGADLVQASGGMCTDCHRGNNPFIVVPGAATDLRTAGVSFSSAWYEPIVGAGWLQNPGPGNVPSGTNPALGPGDGSCLQCHSSAGGSFGGKFPVLGLMANGGSAAYCGNVLDRARILKKMPPFDPGNVSYQKHWDAMFTACQQPGPPTITMPPSVRYALSPVLILVTQLPLL